MPSVSLAKRKHTFSPFFAVADIGSRLSIKKALATPSVLTKVLIMDEFLEEMSKFSFFRFTADTDPKKKEMMEKLLSYELAIMIESNRYRLTTKGYTVKEKGFDNWLAEQNDQKEKEDLKIDLDIELARKTLKEFPRTKFLAWGGFTIGVVLALKELGIWLWQLLFQ